MELKGNHICAFFTTLFLLAICVISFATKGMYLEYTPDLTNQEIVNPEVFRSVEGLICIDALFGFYCLLFFVIICRPCTAIVTIFQFLLVLILIGRFVLGVTFLAGDDNYGKYWVTWYDDLSSDERAAMSIGDRRNIVSLKGAWVFEIIAIISTNILSGLLLLLQHKIKHLISHDHDHDHNHNHHHEHQPIKDANPEPILTK